MANTIVNSPNAPAPIGPYSHAVLAGNTLYISGQIALDAESGNLINETIEAETHQVMKNLKSILQQAGMDFSNVLKSTIFLMDMGQFTQVNEVYGSYFEEEAPARETVQVAGLPKGVKVEISMIAAK